MRLLTAALVLVALALPACFPRVNGMRVVPRVSQRTPSMMVTDHEGVPISEPPRDRDDDTWYVYFRGAW